VHRKPSLPSIDQPKGLFEGGIISMSDFAKEKILSIDEEANMLNLATDDHLKMVTIIKARQEAIV
jgi:hypothetical protein